MTYNTSMVFIETSHFTKALNQYLNDDEYRELQLYLMINPHAGDIIRGGGGIRKLRWSRPAWANLVELGHYISGQNLKHKYTC